MTHRETLKSLYDRWLAIDEDQIPPRPTPRWVAERLGCSLFQARRLLETEQRRFRRTIAMFIADPDEEQALHPHDLPASEQTS